MKSEKIGQSAVARLRSISSVPSPTSVSQSRRRVLEWFDRNSPLIQWNVMRSPLGPLYVAVSRRGLCALDFGIEEEEFISRLDPRARLRRNPEAVADVSAQLSSYFAARQFRFKLPVDLTGLTAFQGTVLKVTCRIRPGEVWTYHEVAQKMGRPESSRPVGQALARNPIPIVIPCHRVIATDGNLRGYSGGSGIAAKQWLLDWEGAELPRRKTR